MNKYMKDLSTKDTKELLDIVQTLKSQLLEINFLSASGDNSKLNKKQLIKKTIARALTIINQREKQQTK